jgi:hypothetical protein
MSEHSNPAPVSRQDVYAAIDRERVHQQRKWGTGPLRSVAEWLLILEEELREARLAYVKTGRYPDTLRELVQVAACACAALEQHGVVERGG